LPKAANEDPEARVRDISAWLHELGLEKYAKAFHENEIDFESLPFLTENMLVQIGLPIGPRARLLAAISELPLSSNTSRRGGRGAMVQPAVKWRNERRQVTVMFCDLVNSTKLAGTLDPEDLGSIFDAYQTACRKVVERYEGHIAQYRGDGIEVIFGWPTAQEDAAERAVRSALEVIEAVKRLASPEPLSVRVGISTGIVVTGVGDPLSPSNAVGETLHIAARLEQIATPNNVVISESTSRFVAGRFDLEDLGLQQLKGVADAVRAYRVVRVRQGTSRFQAALRKAMTPLVGRGAELRFLQQRWLEALEGDGQAVFISGVPGVGKSRVVYELAKLIEANHTLGLQCLPHCMQSALFPVIQCIGRLAEFANEDSDELKLEKIEKLVSQATDKTENLVPIIADLMSIPAGPRYRPLHLTAQQLKIQTLNALIERLIEFSAKHPLFLVLEDAHWIDPSTQELLDLLLGQIQKGRVLLLVTHRPEYQLSSGVRANVSQLTIARLARRELALMAKSAIADKPISTIVMERIIEESDSIPLFIEELIRGIESGGAIERDLLGKDTKPTSDFVPDSLRDSLMARLDRVPQARSVAQVAAVFGREFSYDMLHRVTALTGPELDLALAHLRESDIIQLVDTRSPVRYVFKHSLLRDAAYESLLRSDRREIHAKIASLLEKESPEIVAAQPELLAYHYSFAGKTELAVRQWVLGGRRARSRWANLEAVVQFEKALRSLETLPETPERMSVELDIHLSMGLCLIAVHGYSADDTRKAFEHGLTLSGKLGDAKKETQAIFGLWGHYWMRASHERAIEFAATLLAKSEQLHDQVLEILGHRCLGSTLFTFGDFVRAREHLEAAIALGQRAATDIPLVTFAVDPRVASQLIFAWDLWILGYPDQARDNVLEVLGHELTDPYTVAFAHYVTSAVHLLRGEGQDAMAHAERSLEVSREHGINLYALYSRFGRGCALTKIGQKQQGLIEIMTGIEEAQRSNLGYMRGFMLGWLGTAQADNGDSEAALSTIDEGLKEINDETGRAWEAELQRLHGDILLKARPDAAKEAERSYRDAIAIAQRQQARSLELRATTSLARLLQRSGRNNEAREHLAGIFDWFTEGFDTVDLKEATTLLKALKKI
jgi:class 3 adenylate cyclase/tetratricopeptide (TPR) repeat protein